MGYRRYGADPANALAQARIPPEALAKPESRVTAAQMEIMSGVAMQELDDEALGWFSRKLPWGSYGMLCRASLTSPDLGVALKRWCRHHRLLTDDIVLHFEATRTVANLTITVGRELGEMREFCLVTTLRYLLGYACWAIDSRIPLLAARFPFDPPAHRGVYPLLFQGPVQFNAEQAGISFDAQYLSLPLRRDERALRQMLQRALPLTVLQYRRDRLLMQRVRQLLRNQPEFGTTAAGLAERLHVSPRTLHRQLHEEGASLQQLKDEARRDRAMDLLNRSSRPIKQIAQAVGFRSEKSFARAFRQWTGESPSGFRDRNTEVGPGDPSDRSAADG
jgi:AraC-like DNA-binding protein